MAYPTDTFTAADLDVMIPEVWGNKINDFYRSKLVLGEFFIDRSSELSEGGDTLFTPNMTEFTANAKSNAAAVTLIGGLIIQLKQSIMNVYENTMLYLRKNNIQTA